MFKSIPIMTSPKRILWLLMVVFFLMLLTPPSREYFFEMSKRWLYIFSFAFSLSFVLTPLMIMLARKLQVLDTPDDRKVHDRATPLFGGVAVIAAFVASLLANMVLDSRITFFLCGATLIALISLIDDWRGLSARLKLLVQIAVVLCLINHGVILSLFP